MTRANTKIGDIFEVKISDTHKKYFQYIISDLTQLNSDVIRAFKKSYPIESIPELAEIINDEVDFYAHCVTKWGITLGLWEKVGNSKNVGPTDQILFRGTSDYGIKEGDELVKISNNWHIWHINDEYFTDVGKLQGKNRNAEIGVVINPYDIVERIKTGKYKFFYPGFK